MRLRRNITRALIAASLVLAFAAGLAGWQWRSANQSAVEAKQSADEAIEARDEAKLSADEAIKARDDLERAAKERAVELTRFAWLELGTKQEEVIRLTAVAKTLNQKPEVLIPDILKKEQPDGFDCKTNLYSGFRHLYCLVRNVISFEKAQSIAGLSIFRPDGPHDKELNLGDPYRFGHYNPEFLEWLDDHIIPRGMDDVRFNQLTQLVYETHVGPVARALYNAHQILFAGPEAYRAFELRYQFVKNDHLERLRRRETTEARFYGDPITFAAVKAAYLRRIDRRTEPGNDLQENFRWLSDYLATDKNDDWYLANTAGGFWVRRSIDGTEAQIFRLLTKLLQYFEPTMLAEALFDRGEVNGAADQIAEARRMSPEPVELHKKDSLPTSSARSWHTKTA